jgi:hypothetical protein
METIKNDFITSKEAEENGLMVAMGSTIERIRTDLNKKLSDYFRKKFHNFKGNYDEFEGEEILCNINEYLSDINKKTYTIDFPYSEGSEIHLIPIGENIELKLIVADEYHGSGEYSKYVMIEFFIINERTTEKDVDFLIETLNKYYIS